MLDGQLLGSYPDNCGSTNSQWSGLNWNIFLVGDSELEQFSDYEWVQSVSGASGPPKSKREEGHEKFGEGEIRYDVPNDLVARPLPFS